MILKELESNLIIRGDITAIWIYFRHYASTSIRRIWHRIKAEKLESSTTLLHEFCMSLK